MDRFDFARELVLRAGRRLLDEHDRLTDADLVFKSPKDLVTRLDLEVEALLVGAIRERFPRDAILAEERPAPLAGGSGWQWIIDPLDGTTNYVHRLPFYSVVIALADPAGLAAGLVYAPKLGELFTARRGAGARLDDRPLRVSRTTRLVDALGVTGFACLRANLARNNLPLVAAIAPRLRGLRRFGSAALDLAYVAAGRTDFFWELHLQPWDTAAGVLLVREAGGVVTDLRGDPAGPYFTEAILAAAPGVHAEALAILRGEYYTANSEIGDRL